MATVTTAAIACSQVHRSEATADIDSAVVSQADPNADPGATTTAPIDDVGTPATAQAGPGRAEVVGRLPELVQEWNSRRAISQRFPEVDRRVDGAWRTMGSRSAAPTARGNRAPTAPRQVAALPVVPPVLDGQNGQNRIGGPERPSIIAAATPPSPCSPDDAECATETAATSSSPALADGTALAVADSGAGTDTAPVVSANDKASQMDIQTVGSHASSIPSWLFWLLWILVALLVLGLFRYLSRRGDETNERDADRDGNALDDGEEPVSPTSTSPSGWIADARDTDGVSPGAADQLGAPHGYRQGLQPAYDAQTRFDIVDLGDDPQPEAIPGATKLELDVGNETRAAISRYIEGASNDSQIAVEAPTGAARIAAATEAEENHSNTVSEEMLPDEAPAPVLTEEDRRLNEILAAAQKALAEENLGKALELLSPLSQQPDPPIGVLMAVGSVWWKMAEKTGSAESYGSAADAFARILEKEPDRQSLHYRIGYCRLLQAQKQTGLQQIASLNEAVDRLSMASNADDGNPRLLTDLGYALLQRSSLTLGDKSEEYALAEQAFRSALKKGAPQDSDAAWLLQRVLRLRAGISQGAEAAGYRAEVDALVAQALENNDAGQRAVWQASAVQNALETVQGEGLSGAARRMRLREVQAKYRPWIVEGTPAPIMLSWVKLLSAEAEGLMGAARREKYLEAEQALKLTAPGGEQQGEMELRLMVARMARLRGQLENTSIRLMLLGSADKQLQSYLEAPNSNEVKLEAANIALEQATLLRPPASQQAYKRAMSLVEPLIETPAMEAEALQCYLKAALMVDDNRDHTAAVLRLMELAPESSETWIIGARWALSRHDYEKASTYCESAWQLGASRATLIPLWQQVNDDWTSSSETEAPTLAAAKRRLRKLKQAVK